jgi:hypothetical protein
VKEARRRMKKKEAHLGLGMDRLEPGTRYLRGMESAVQGGSAFNHHAGSRWRERTRGGRNESGSPVE